VTPFLLPLHGLGSRQDLPLPFGFVLLGAAVAVVASFAVLVVAWRRPKWQAPPAGLPLPRLSRVLLHPVVLALVRLAVLLLWGVAALALWAGQDRVTNPVFGFTYVWLWVGVVPVSLLFGPVWAALNPFRTLYRGLTGLQGWVSRSLSPSKGPQASTSSAIAPPSTAHPDASRLGLLPAAVTVLGFTWLELVQPGNNTLGVLRWWAAAWFVVVLGGAMLRGEGWFGQADPFEAWAGLVARLSPWRVEDGLIRLVNPLHHLAGGPHRRGTWALTSVLLGSTAFDSFGAGGTWVRFVQATDVARPVWGTLGLLAMVALVAFSFRAGLGRLSPDVLAASLVPIATGYALGHYLSLLVLEGQRTLVLLSDPLGLGWNLFGTAEWGISMLWLDSGAATALVQLLAIVGGHVLGVFVAHDLAIARLEPGRVVTGQLPLLLVMVGYTVAGLLLLFQV
jgi:hypothetical protein